MNLLIYEIPGRENIEVQNIVFDYNGTIAVDGKLINGVEELINKLAEYVKIYILTADTYGTVEKECIGINGKILTFPKDNAGDSKKEIVRSIKGNTVCLGNGYNDIPMFKEAILSIAIIEREGASGELLSKADIVVKSTIDALNILLNKNMVKATLRS
ncbi:ATPase P [Tissierella sp.]|uniref:HAD family hydrolase n=1 Tax=Tissierella sp. TaxID=41274 RepID=UPI0028AA43FB|nr:ATPase P [Tissierella sp.]